MKFTKAEIDAIIEASPRTLVPFNKLVLSEDYQARSGGGTPKISIAELSASIKESGVLQNLIVRLKDEWVPEIHLDTDEANALGLADGDCGTLVQE